MEQNLQILRDEMSKDIDEANDFLSKNEKGLKKLKPSLAIKILSCKCLIVVLNKYIGRIDEICGLQ